MRNMKILGLAVVSILAMSIAASAAQAASFTASGGAGITLSGSQVSKIVITTAVGSMKCSSVSLSGTTTGTSSTAETIGEGFVGCVEGGALVVDVSMTSCDFIIHPNGTEEIHCSVPGDHIDFTVTSETGSSRCTITIPPQTLGGMTYASNGAGLTVSTGTTGLKYIIHSSGCLAGTEGEHSDGTESGSASLRAASGSFSIDTP